MPNGCTGNLLHVNLTGGTWLVERPNEAYYRSYLGGGATSSHYLLASRTLAGSKLDREAFAQSLRTYYGMMGWDPETSAPTPTKLAELDLRGM